MTKPTYEQLQQAVKIFDEHGVSADWIKGFGCGRKATIKQIRTLIPKCHDLNRLDQLLDRMENE